MLRNCNAECALERAAGLNADEWLKEGRLVLMHEACQCWVHFNITNACKSEWPKMVWV